MTVHGMPARGSIRDRIASEMLYRERRSKVTGLSYIGRLLSTTLNLPEATFRLWTTLLNLEITQENYSPETVEEKKKAIEILDQNKSEDKNKNVRVFEKLRKLTVDEDDLRPASPEEIELLKRKLRKRHVRTREDTSE